MANANEVLLITDENSEYLFADLLQVEGINKYIIRSSNYKLVNIVRKIHLTPKLAKYVWLPKRDGWFDKKYIINKTPNNGCILVNSSAMVLPTVEFWNDIHCKRPDVKFVLLLVDSMHVKGGHMSATRKRLKEIKWDLVLSYDKFDCAEYGFKYIGYDYYSRFDIQTNNNIEFDLYYISSVKKGKEILLRAIKNECEKNQVKIFFQIMSRWRKINYGQCIRKCIPYEEVVANVERSNCILEVLQEGQKTQSIRYLEAIVYNKKLLSNNINLSKLPYYNSKYMKYYKDIKDIDWQWVTKKENVDYHYNDDFSAANILKYIEI